MSTKQEELIDIQYKYDEDLFVKLTEEQKQKLFMSLGLMVFFVATGLLYFPLLMLCATIPLFYVLVTLEKKRVVKKIIFGPRYLICGKTVIYYQNISKIIKYNDKIYILCADNSSFIIYRNKFVCYSRKAAKIKAKLDLRFATAASALFDKAKAANKNIIWEIQ